MAETAILRPLRCCFCNSEIHVYPFGKYIHANGEYVCQDERTGEFHQAMPELTDYALLLIANGLELPTPAEKVQMQREAGRTLTAAENDVRVMARAIRRKRGASSAAEL